MDSLYFMRNGDPNVVKIGRARDTERRRSQFMTANHEPVTFDDVVETDNARPVETILHRIYYASRVRGEFYALAPAEVEEAGRQAREIIDQFLPLEKEAKRLAKLTCDGPPRPPTDRERELHRDVIEKRQAKYRAELECDQAENAYKVAIGTSEGLEGLSGWPSEEPLDFDEAGFKLKHPEIYDAFCRPVPRRTLRLLWT
jgi:Meiotically up-regulated gene 113